MAAENVVVVAVRAEREISKTALAWALTHIVRPGDLVTLLAVLSDHENLGWRQRFFRGFSSRANHGRDKCQISASCSKVALQIDGRNEINVRIKVVGADGKRPNSAAVSGEGVVVAEAKRMGANWVVLDKKLKQEQKNCMDQLHCNIAVMTGSSAKVLRLNLGAIPNKPLALPSAESPEYTEKFPDINSQHAKQPNDINVNSEQPPKHSETKKNEWSSGRAVNSALLHNPLFENNGCSEAIPLSVHLGFESRQRISRRDYSLLNQPAATKHLRGISWTPENQKLAIQSNNTRSPKASVETLQERLASEYKYHRLAGHRSIPSDCLSFSSEVREAVSLYGGSQSVPPPLCSVCRHKGPMFGKPPRRFTYSELETATDGFSDENFMGKGGSGSVYRGVLDDGQIVAVKQLKVAGSGVAEESEFCAVVEVLSRAQHRNVVMLVGFCAEGKNRILIYEFICNGSMDTHLHGRGNETLNWEARMKIAVGVARGLRYLHEDCRVGFVVHKHMRPNNILLTHDYEPLVGDFRLTRWQSEASLIADIRSAEAFGYLAPEYIECGTITDKSDVYAYGVILLELITGRKAMETSQQKGQQFLVDWTRPLLSQGTENDTNNNTLRRFLDPDLGQDLTRDVLEEVRAMVRAAALCLHRDPQSRPGMSKVLRILEGDTNVDPVLDFSSIGSRSGRVTRPIIHGENERVGSLSCRFSQEAVSSALCSERSWITNCKKS